MGLSKSGFGEDEIEKFISRHLGFKIAYILQTCQKEHLIPKSYAKGLALKRFSKLKQKFETHQSLYFINKILRTITTHGTLPKMISSTFGNWYYQRLMQQKVAYKVKTKNHNDGNSDDQFVHQQ